MPVGLGQVLQHVGPVARCPGRGGLGEVAEHGERAGGGPPAEGAQHHRGQVLRLVDHDVRHGLGPVQQVGDLVEQHQVRRRPAGGARRARRSRPDQEGLLVLGEDAVGVLGEELRVGQQPVEQPARLDHGPDGGRVVPHGLGPGQHVPRLVVEGVAGLLDLHQHPVREGVPELGRAQRVAHVARPDLLDGLARLVRRDPPAERAAGQHQGLLRGADVGPDGAAQHLGQPPVALEGRDVGGLGGADRGVVAHDLLDGRLAGVDLAQGGQDVADVPQEALVRPDDEHAPASELVAVRVQEVGRAVQAHGGLSRARRTLDHERALERHAHDDVLLGLDRRDDVAHGAGARALDLGLEDLRVRVGVAVGKVAGQLGPGQRLVLERREMAAGEPVPAPCGDAHRLLGRGPVERRADGSAPVHDHGLAVRVGHVAAPDVEGLAGGGGLARDEVDAAEEERDLRVVGELLHPARERGLQDLRAHPVARVAAVESGDPVAHPPEL